MKFTVGSAPALGVATDSIDEVKSLPESHFPTEEVARLESENKLLKLQLKAVKVQRVFLFD